MKIQIMKTDKEAAICDLSHNFNFTIFTNVEELPKPVAFLCSKIMLKITYTSCIIIIIITTMIFIVLSS